MQYFLHNLLKGCVKMFERIKISVFGVLDPRKNTVSIEQIENALARLGSREGFHSSVSSDNEKYQFWFGYSSSEDLTTIIKNLLENGKRENPKIKLEICLWDLVDERYIPTIQYRVDPSQLEYLC